MREAELDLAHLQDVAQEGLSALAAAGQALRDAADSEKDVVGVDPTASSAGHDSKMVDSMLQTVLDCFSQWLRQGHCDGFARGTPAANVLATRARRLESSPGCAGVLGAAKALLREHFATEALALQSDAEWLRGLGIHWRLDYGSRPRHTSGLASGQEYVGLRNLGNSCYLNAVVQCFYSCGSLREDVSRQSPAKGPLASCMQRLFLQLSGENGHWDYVSPAALLHQLFLTDCAAFQPGESADVLECCSLLLPRCSLGGGCPVAALRDLRVDTDLGSLTIQEIDAPSVRALVMFNEVQLPDDESLQQDPQSASAMRVKRSVDCCLSVPDAETLLPFRSKIRAAGPASAVNWILRARPGEVHQVVIMQADAENEWSVLWHVEVHEKAVLAVNAYYSHIISKQTAAAALSYASEWTPGKRVRTLRDSMPTPFKTSSAWQDQC